MTAGMERQAMQIQQATMGQQLAGETFERQKPLQQKTEWKEQQEQQEKQQSEQQQLIKQRRAQTQKESSGSGGDVQIL